MLLHSSLKAKQRGRRADFTPSFGLRIHRAISWLGRAESESDDLDVRFILMWIAFNAAYARDGITGTVGERDEFREFFEKLVAGDADNRIYQTIWDRFSQEIRILLNNQYIFSPFWQHHNGKSGFEDWASTFEASKRRIARALSMKDTVLILQILFDRLYVLRNQLIHGGATWNGGVNRSQVRDGAAILSTLLPIFIDTMMDNHALDWGPAFYPVLE